MIKSYKKLKQKIVSINWGESWEKEESILMKLFVERASFPRGDTVYDSIYQYKAQSFYLNYWQFFFLNVISFFGFWFLLLRYFLKNTRKFKKEPKDVVFFYKPDIFSKEEILSKRLIYVPPEALKLKIEDIKFLLKLGWRYNVNFNILCISLYRIAQVRFAIDRYSISEVWSNMEYSCSCGILRLYCSKKNILLKNFMHGEKILSLRDAFCSFDYFYVWNEHYKLMFEKLHYNGEILVDNPWKADVDNFSKVIPKSICYFFKGAENNEEIQNLIIVFKRLTELGYTVSLKNHPRNLPMTKYFPEYKVVNTNDDLKLILSEYEFVCAQYSTVNFQSWSMGGKLLIDDISNLELSNGLKTRDYIFTKEMERVKLLSSLC